MKLRQLKMYHLLKKLDDVALPEGYSFRTYRPGEELVWADIMKYGLVDDTTPMEGWKGCILDRAEQGLVPERDVIFVCDPTGKPVASITAYVHQDTGEGDIHMVAAKPEGRGKKLGFVMLNHAMHKLNGEITGEHRLVHLTTDDWRIPAIVGYLRGGFQPVLYDDTMEPRWRKVAWETNIHGIEFLDNLGNPTGLYL